MDTLSNGKEAGGHMGDRWRAMGLRVTLGKECGDNSTYALYGMKAIMCGDG